MNEFLSRNITPYEGLFLFCLLCLGLLFMAIFIDKYERKRDMKNKYNFEGWDFSELAKHFNIELFDDSPKELIDFLENQGKGGKFPAETVEVCRAFAAKINDVLKKQDKRRESGEFQVFNGLCKIQSDWTFMKYFLVLLPHMWT